MEGSVAGPSAALTLNGSMSGLIANPTSQVHTWYSVFERVHAVVAALVASDSTKVSMHTHPPIPSLAEVDSTGKVSFAVR